MDWASLIPFAQMETAPATAAYTKSTKQKYPAHTLSCLFYLSAKKCFQTQRYREAEYSKIKMVTEICGNFIV